MNIPIIQNIATKNGEQHKIFLCSDLHFGCKDQDIKKLRRDFDKAKKENAKIICYGDWGEFIIPQDKKRYTSSRDKYNNDDQICSTIDEAYDFLKDYADNLLVIGTGNHEASVSKFHSIDPTKTLIYRLRREAGAKELYHGQYAGFIRLCMGRGENGQSNKMIYDIFYTHGQGASSTPSGSMGMLKQHMYNKVANLYCAGHTHAPVYLPCESMMYLNNKGNIKIKERKGVVTGCYSGITSNPYDAMHNGYQPDFGEEKMRNLQGSGGAMLTLTYTEEKIESEVTI